MILIFSNSWDGSVNRVIDWLYPNEESLFRLNNHVARNTFDSIDLKIAELRKKGYISSQEVDREKIQYQTDYGCRFIHGTWEF